MIYPAGSHVQWRTGIDPRDGAQRGTLARDWEEHTAASVLWDGETEAHPEYPECIEVRPLASEKKPTPTPVAVGNRDAWDNYRPERRVRR